MKYRADHVGSLLRPPELLEARHRHAQGSLALEALRDLEDRCIQKALDLQKQAGLDVLSDGEYRRGSWAEAWTRSISGLVPDEGAVAAGLPSAWRGGYLEAEGSRAPSAATGGVSGRMVVGDRIRQVQRLTAHESAYLKQHAGGPFKITLPGITMFATSAYKPGVTNRVYASRWQMIEDLVAIVKREIEALLAEGVTYIQLDSLRYVLPLADADLRRRMVEANEDPEALLDETIACDNACLEGLDRDGVTIALHMCRGNNRSAWGAAGAYDVIAEKAFGRLNVDRFLLEYDDERSGGFEPLRFVPDDKVVVLGLVSSKGPQLESSDALCRRIEAAARYHPLENLALSPQCGFASMAEGNLLTWDDQRHKLDLVVQTARKVWG